jgi:hypothetical protein
MPFLLKTKAANLNRSRPVELRLYLNPISFSDASRVRHCRNHAPIAVRKTEKAGVLNSHLD